MTSNPQQSRVRRRPSAYQTGIRGIALIALCILGTTILGSCRQDIPPAADALLHKDALDRIVDYSVPVRRVASLAPSVTEIIFAAGGLDRLVGVTNADNYPEEVSRISNYSALPIDFEAIVDLRPDLVLATTEVNDPRDAGSFEKLNIPVYFLRNGTLQEVLTSIQLVGEILQTSNRANTAVDSLRSGIDALRLLSDSLVVRPRVLFLISNQTLFSFGPESYVHDLIDLAGGSSITSNFETPAPVLSEEYVLREAPDVIIGTFGDDFSSEDLLRFHPSFKALPAWKNDRIYSINGDIVLRAGPRIIEGARRIHRLLFNDDAANLHSR